MIIKKTKYLLFLLLSLVIVFTGILFWAPSFLDHNAPVKSDNLIVEGWLQACELEQIGDRYQNINELIVVGNEYPSGSGITDRLLSFFEKHAKAEKSDKKGMWLYANSALLFNPEILEFNDEQDSVLIIVQVKGTEANGKFAHFNLIVNCKYTGGSFTTGELKEYVFVFATEKGTINSVGIRFDNDCMSKKKDRNLFIYSVTVAGKQIIADENTSMISTYENRFTTGFTSKAGATLNYLKEVGVNPNNSIAVSFKFAKENQTLAAAHSFRDWVSSTNIHSLNIVSAGVHSRRSLATYNKVLGDDYNIGIISLNSTRYNKSNWWKSPGGWLALIDESISYFVNSIL